VQIVDFELVDVGVFPEDGETQAVFGLGFKGHDSALIAAGDSAKDAFASLLEALGKENLGTSKVQAQGRTMGFETPEAERPAAGMIDDEWPDGAEPVYFVGIRYNDPNAPVDVEEIAAEKGEA